MKIKFSLLITLEVQIEFLLQRINELKRDVYFFLTYHNEKLILGILILSYIPSLHHYINYYAHISQNVTQYIGNKCE